MEKFYDIEWVRVSAEYLEIKIGETEYRFPIGEVSEKLIKANEFERNDYRISPSGYGIHWRLIDEDISINGLLGKMQR